MVSTLVAPVALAAAAGVAAPVLLSGRVLILGPTASHFLSSR
jgi:hypothetical protein